LDLAAYRSCVPSRQRPVIVHAPTHRPFKGTALILATLDRLLAEGVQFDLRLVEKVSNREMPDVLAAADVVIDQLHAPLHGKLGVEAMASGCALATGNRQDLEPFPSSRPIWHLEPANIYEQLKRLLTDSQLRIQLAHDGRSYVERYHDRVACARRIITGLEQQKINGWDHYPTFFTRHYHLDVGECIPRYLKRTTAKILQRWGLPNDIDVKDLSARGLVCEYKGQQFRSIPRWDLKELSGEAVTSSSETQDLDQFTNVGKGEQS
jgi:hypothetical protein